jgi:2-iminoacetate synthase ThiH
MRERTARDKKLAKKIGRSATGHAPQFAFRIPVETIAAIEAWAAQQPDKPSRSEALRRLVDIGLGKVVGGIGRK